MTANNPRVQMREVARHIGVSISSVSRALNDHPDVSALMQDRVRAATKALGYEPDLLAKSLRKGSTKSIGFLLRDISNPLLAEMVKGSEEVFEGLGYSTLLADCDGAEDLEARCILTLRKRRVDGLILSLQSETRQLTLDALRATTCPMVLLDREVPGLRAGVVLCDHESGVGAATADLFAVGHTRIAMIGGPEGIRTTRERLRGFQRAHHERSMEPDPALVRLGSYAKDVGRQQTLDLMGERRPPTAIVAGGAQLAVGALSALHELGLAIGGDVSLVACDEIDLMALLHPPVSVVWRDPRSMGRIAAELLVGMIVRGEEAQTVEIPTVYVKRGSVQPPSR